MPIYEYTCHDAACSERGVMKDHYQKRSDSPAPACPQCANEMKREAISQFQVCWARPLSFYDSKTAQNRGMDSHVAYRIHSSKSGKPEPVVIDSIQKQRDFCREEGLRNPSDLNPHAEINENGTKLQTAGTKGQWV
jgi:hypothetical protein